MSDYITIKNARIHNLKGIDVKIPKYKLTVITGVSGSGKSSLAFDTLYEEGKKRYLMFSGTQFMIDSVPSFDSISGLSPTVAVEQRIIRQSNPRSTVGTRTKLSNMLAMLYASYGTSNSRYDDSEPLSVEMFQKNSPRGMCVKCLGKGRVKRIDEDKLFGDLSQKLEDVCLGVGKRGGIRKLLEGFCRQHKLSLTQELSTLTEEQLLYFKYGDGGKSSFIGYVPLIVQITNGVFSTAGRLEGRLLEAGCLSHDICPKCQGTGLGQQAANTMVMGKTIAELETMYIKDLQVFLQNISPSDNSAHELQALKSSPLLREILTKLTCMADVGLHHLALARPVPTLSGGEIQRLFLASYIIAEMDSIIFIFDEPTIGLHEVEKAQLMRILRNLVDRGNTVIAVEHDENFMRSADYLVDLGPDAGIDGGEMIFQGTFDEFLSCRRSNTSPYLRDKNLLPIKCSYKEPEPQRMLRIEHASLHNLRDVSTAIPLGLMVGVAGVSGSGKSSLIADTLVPELKAILTAKYVTDDGEDNNSEGDKDETVSLPAVANNKAQFLSISGTEHIRRCVIIDQRPIGRSRTSCPATYTGMYDRIRALFARASGLPAGYFSVNSQGGCKTCKGDGEVHYHVGFGNFIDVECENCGGTGFIPEVMAVQLDGRTIKDVLDMTVDEAAVFFGGQDKSVKVMLATLRRVGMGYITLGQKVPTLSGGESQRIKLAKELAKGQKAGQVLYILDEPTTGLSFHDSQRLYGLMQELVDKGNSVIVTEHDPYVLSNCDYIIEMGIGGGSEGGTIIAAGNPAQLKADEHSIIGRYLK